MRVLGGEDYVEYIGDILHEREIEFKSFGEYELLLFDDIMLMHSKIKEKNEIYGLSRLIAGYAWKWKSKKDPNKYDIVIDGYNMRWNSTNKDWINSKNAINEVGCIHTTQGYDINYAGIIIGNELTYRNGKIEVLADNYYDVNGKKTIKDSEVLKNYVLNIYKTIMTRGIRGTYIYVCDKALRDYFKNFVPMYNDVNIAYKDINKGVNVEV